MHIAIIMDGNGRWARRRHFPRTAGHRAGAKAVDTIVEAAARRGVRTLTLYAFSAANWERPVEEVTALFGLFRLHLLIHTQRCLENSVRINVIGRRDRLDAGLQKVIDHSERVTANCSKMLLRIAVDYSAQHSIVAASQRVCEAVATDRRQFSERLAAVDHSVHVVPDIDLLIRTGGERRLSDFLLWECAYAELYFTDCFWPDFDEPALAAALEEFALRERRFGRIDAGTVESSHA
jgi:undecaprenyl diphosphate synthase